VNGLHDAKTGGKCRGRSERNLKLVVSKSRKHCDWVREWNPRASRPSDSERSSVEFLYVFVNILGCYPVSSRRRDAGAKGLGLGSDGREACCRSLTSEDCML
jgi:hypothetical protein